MVVEAGSTNGRLLSAMENSGIKGAAVPGGMCTYVGVSGEDRYYNRMATTTTMATIYPYIYLLPHLTFLNPLNLMFCMVPDQASRLVGGWV